MRTDEIATGLKRFQYAKQIADAIEAAKAERDDLKSQDSFAIAYWDSHPQGGRYRDLSSIKSFNVDQANAAKQIIMAMIDKRITEMYQQLEQL